MHCFVRGIYLIYFGPGQFCLTLIQSRLIFDVMFFFHPPSYIILRCYLLPMIFPTFDMSSVYSLFTEQEWCSVSCCLNITVCSRWLVELIILSSMDTTFSLDHDSWVRNSTLFLSVKHQWNSSPQFLPHPSLLHPSISFIIQLCHRELPAPSNHTCKWTPLCSLQGHTVALKSLCSSRCMYSKQMHLLYLKYKDVGLWEKH